MSDSDLKKFDFQKPSGLSKDLIEQLRTWMNSFSNLFHEKWSGIIASDIEIQYQSDTAYSFAVLKNRMPKPSVGYLIKFMDGGVDSMIVLGRSTAVSIVMEMTGDPFSEPEERNLSTVENALFEIFTRELVAAISESWIDQNTLKIDCTGQESRPHRSRIFNPKTIMLNLKFQLTQGDKVFDMFWIVPQTPFEQLLSNSIQPAPNVENQFREMLEERTKNVKVNLSVLLGSAELSFSEMTELSAGDVIVLNRKITDPLPVHVEEKEKFSAWPGRQGNTQAVKICKAV
jgi:flagellar motor switch protein FliM